MILTSIIGGLIVIAIHETDAQFFVGTGMVAFGILAMIAA